MRRNFLRSLAAVTAGAFCLKPSVAKPVGVITTVTCGDTIHFARDGEVFKTVCEFGTYWFRNGKLHREDGPARDNVDGRKEWHRNGKLHREDGPAVEMADGEKEWWLNGERHREDGPACEYVNRHREWWVNGKRHRTDGPAVEHLGGYKEWHRNGEMHKVVWGDSLKLS
jgi:hypothetical protein